MAEHKYACPRCLRALERDDAGHTCHTCNGSFPTRGGVPQLIDWRSIEREPKELIGSWHLTQLASLDYYAANATDSCADASRTDVQAVRSFVDFAGLDVLDVGSGAFVRPGYVSEDVGRYVGIDPIIPKEAPDFELVNAFAEQLPFEDDEFDVVLFATSLDHVLHVPSTLIEADRVLRPGGHIYFWGGVTADPGSYREVATAPVMQRDQPLNGSDPLAASDRVGAWLETVEAERSPYERHLIDEFHVRHFTPESVHSVFESAGFVSERRELIVENYDVTSAVYDFVRAADLKDRALPLGQLADLEYRLERATAQRDFAVTQHREFVLSRLDAGDTRAGSAEERLAILEAAPPQIILETTPTLDPQLIAEIEAQVLTVAGELETALLRVTQLESQVSELSRSGLAGLVTSLRKIRSR